MSEFQKSLAGHRNAVEEYAKNEAVILSMGQSIVDALKAGNKVLIFGNGGSAADAQHFAAELSGRYLKERQGLAGLALTTDTSALTAIGNDYGFDQVFARQVQALAKPGDVLVGISTSGRSPNVLEALKTGKEMGTVNLAFTGYGTLELDNLCDQVLKIIVSDTPHIQEMHILAIHTLCGMVDQEF